MVSIKSPIRAGHIVREGSSYFTAALTRFMPPCRHIAEYEIGLVQLLKLYGISDVHVGVHTPFLEICMPRRLCAAIACSRIITFSLYPVSLPLSCCLS